jgi:hypothetical protein
LEDDAAMPSGEWEDFADEYGFSWDDVEEVHVIRDDLGWDLEVVTSDGSMLHADLGWSDGHWQDAFWDDLYDWLIEEDIDIERVIEYG